MIKRIIIYPLIATIIGIGILCYHADETVRNDKYEDYFVRGYVRAIQDRTQIEKYPVEERTMRLYLKFAKEAIEYIQGEM